MNVEAQAQGSRLPWHAPRPGRDTTVKDYAFDASASIATRRSNFLRLCCQVEKELAEPQMTSVLASGEANGVYSEAAVKQFEDCVSNLEAELGGSGEL